MTPHPLVGQAHLIGGALWTPGYADVDAWMAGREDPALDLPPCEAVPSRLRRWISLLSRMLVEVGSQAIHDAGVDASEVATVFGSAHGEIQIAVDQMRMMKEGDGKVSPACFKNSVHNTAGGLLSIATGNRGFATALAAGDETFAMCLLEALGLLSDGEDAVLVAVADETLPPPLDRVATYAPLGAAFVMTREPAPGAPALQLVGPGTPEAAPSPLPERFTANPCAPAIALLEAWRHARPGPVAVDPRSAARWWAELSWEDAS